MEKHKICPILRPQVNMPWQLCQQDACGWWSKDRCGIVALAEAYRSRGAEPNPFYANGPDDGFLAVAMKEDPFGEWPAPAKGDAQTDVPQEPVHLADAVGEPKNVISDACISYPAGCYTCTMNPRKSGRRCPFAPKPTCTNYPDLCHTCTDDPMKTGRRCLSMPDTK